jgi:prolyl 4-hydroxylase
MKVNHLNNNITTIEDFLTQEECQNYITLSENLGYEIAKLDIGKVVAEVRNNDRAFYESPELAAQLFERAKPHLLQEIGNSILVGFNELFRFYKYQQGHKFRKHLDGNFMRNETEASYFTFLIYLNEGYEGGETLFSAHKITPKTGMALVFPHNLLHEGSEVLSGIKYVLRTDIMYAFQA